LDEFNAALAAIKAAKTPVIVAGGGVIYAGAEVALAGTAKALPDGLAISGRVDRLVVTPRRVTVIDYKTNRPAPADISAADRSYVAQLAIYAAVLGEVFPGREVRAALVWTDGPKLMPVPEKMMVEALADLPGTS
jgi:ATP-dependent helicase/nuclease subunit A